jgi:acyl-CoA thioesterase
MTFAEATSVTKVGEGRYTTEIQPGWDIMEITNGGYLMAVAGRAMTDASDGRHLVSLTGHFMNPGRAGPAEIAVEHLKTGRRYTTSRAVLTTGGKPLITVTGSLAEPAAAGTTPSLLTGSSPSLPDPDECVRAVSSGSAPFPPPMVDLVDQRVHPEDAELARGRPTGQALVRGWFRLLDDEPVDELAVVLATDAFMPAIFNTDHPMTWTPTLDLTVHIRNPGPHEWLACKFQTRFVTGGFLEEDGEIWDGSGNLVALSRQLAVVGR